MRTIRKTAITGALLTLGFLPAVEAAQPASNTWVLTIYHQRGEYELRSEGADQREFKRRLGEQIPIELETDEKVIVTIADPNPFLYEYSWQSGEPFASENFKSLKPVIQALETFNGLIGATIRGLDKNDAGKDVNLTMALLNSRESAVLLMDDQNKEANKSRVAAAREEILEAKTVKQLQDIGEKIEELVQCLQALPGMIGELDSGTQSTSQLRGRLSGVQGKQDSVAKELAELDKAIIEARKAIFAGGEGADSLSAILSMLVGESFVRANAPTVEKGFATLADFQKGLDKADKIAREDRAEITYNTEMVQPGRFEIKAIEDPPKGVKPTRRIGVTNFQFKPYSSFVLGLGAGAVYSFVERPKFEAKAKGDGFEIIEKDSDDYVGFNLAALLTITPHRWYKSDFHPLFELGVKPDTDNLGLYAGVAVAYGKNFGLGVGVAFEQVDELADGLKVGQALTAANELKLDKKFRSGVYLHLTAKFDVGAGAK